MKRSIVRLKYSNESIYIPKFSDCLLECFHKNKNSIKVKCSLDGSYLNLEENKKGYELRHSPICPIKLVSGFHYSNNDNSKNGNYVNVATSVVIESADNHILLTKRAHTLKTSPGVWVTPGGYIENNETIFNAGIREVKEETGLDIANENLKILCLWENVYPLVLGMGQPLTHVLIVYTYVKLNDNHDKLVSKIIPNPYEVDSFCWISDSVVANLLKKNGIIELQSKQYFIQNEKLKTENLDIQLMFNRLLWDQSQPFSGVNFALRKWSEKINQNIIACKF